MIYPIVSNSWTCLQHHIEPMLGYVSNNISNDKIIPLRHGLPCRGYAGGYGWDVSPHRTPSQGGNPCPEKELTFFKIK